MLNSTTDELTGDDEVVQEPGTILLAEDDSRLRSHSHMYLDEHYMNSTA